MEQAEQFLSLAEILVGAKGFLIPRDWRIARGQIRRLPPEASKLAIDGEGGGRVLPDIPEITDLAPDLIR